mgnify:FL=1|tara:strand:- start:162 stop:581 length:420 start_codon:yes stop_codon:yes gene_type:complete
MKLVIVLAACIVGFCQASSASDIPTTNWGAVLKVPLGQIAEVEKGLVEWGNWIKETHPMGDEDLGLDSLTITKGNPVGDHVYYVIVERYDTTDGLKNHQSLFRRDVSGNYASMFSKLGFMRAYRLSGSEQLKTLFSIVP